MKNSQIKTDDSNSMYLEPMVMISLNNHLYFVNNLFANSLPNSTPNWSKL